MLTVYKILSWMIYLCVPVILLLRILRGREEWGRMRERFGAIATGRNAPKNHAPKIRPIWFHAASMGEVMSIWPLVKDLRQKSDHHILITTATRTAADFIEMRIADEKHEHIFHLYVPFDISHFTDRFIRNWQPQLGIFVESEIWPHLIFSARKMNIPLLLVNGRISERSFKRYLWVKRILQKIFAQFEYILAQDAISHSHFQKLGAEKAQDIGNLKFDAPLLPYKRKELKDLRDKIADRPVWVAASIHPGEEEMLAQAQKTLQKSHPDLLLIVIPRHAHRGDQFASRFTACGLSVAQRRKQQQLSARTNIYLADTMGEMGLFYRLAKICFMGGSLVPHGGQNPLEPARLKCALIHGFHIDNFREIYSGLNKTEAAYQLTNEGELSDKVRHFIEDKKAAEACGRRAYHFVKGRSGALGETAKIIETILETG